MSNINKAAKIMYEYFKSVHDKLEANPNDYSFSSERELDTELVRLKEIYTSCCDVAVNGPSYK